MPLKSSPSHTAYLLPPGSTSIFMLCDTFHPHCLSVFFFPPLSGFLLSCLSLAFPVYFSPWLAFIQDILCDFLPLSPSVPPLCIYSLFTFAYFLTFALSCLSHRDWEGIGIDSRCSRLCSLIGQRRSGAAGEWANNGLRAPAGWQWPEGKWSHRCLEIWPAFGYVLTNGKVLSDLLRLPIVSPLNIIVCNFHYHSLLYPQAI